LERQEHLESSRIPQPKMARPDSFASVTKTGRVLIPVLFNDMERDFMVWVGNDNEADGHVEQDGTVIYAHDYFAALAALAAFRADRTNATIRFAR
jgi:hypothetical protein